MTMALSPKKIKRINCALVCAFVATAAVICVATSYLATEVVTGITKKKLTLEVVNKIEIFAPIVFTTVLWTYCVMRGERPLRRFLIKNRYRLEKKLAR